MDLWSSLQNELRDQIDPSVFSKLYQRISVDPNTFYTRLQKQKLVFCAYETGYAPPRHALMRSAQSIRQGHSSKAALSGLLSSFHPILVIPSEISLLLIQLQLCQKLSLIYGIDPHSRFGRNQMIAALLFAHQPYHLVDEIGKEESFWRESGRRLLPIIIKKGIKRRLIRIIPGVGGILSYRELNQIGKKLIAWYDNQYQESRSETPILKAQEATRSTRKL
ncbi:MAG: hypothetical protein VX278_05555 [Myxococcota bacterium]|nr:hypothetical protein [Myxococcota bacterium]